MNKNTREEYLETLYKLSRRKDGEELKTGEIADAMEISPPSVTEVLSGLDEDGFVEYIPYKGARLTEKGREEGERIVRTHRVLEGFLVEYFSMDKDKVHEKACEMEHIFDIEMIDTMCERLGAPSQCPHGKKIPSCDETECPVEDSGR
ncbi:MAG: metal-dependent transcriptional regulator [Candidatus Thermoplasmatota archaeon]